MATVKQLLQKKGTSVYSVPLKSTVHQALTLMSEKGCGAVIVLDVEAIAGIFSERDYARKVLSENCSMEMPVDRFMTREVYVVSPDSSIDECMTLMTQKKFRHLPVVDKDQVVGVISIGDIVKDVIENKEIMIRSLENYIVGHDFNQ
jgi:CBS domain-containing protein